MKTGNILLKILIICTFISISSGSVAAGPFHDLPRKTKQQWVDSVYQSLDTNQRISQLFIIRAFSTRDQKYTDSLSNVILTWNVGGVCFFKGTPFAQATLTNRWQDSVKTPLLVAIDAEWGLGMRLDSAYDFPYQMTLGAIKDDSLIYRMASQIAKDCRRVGVNINLAPDVDINNNPMNPVINIRSFGEERDNVAQKGLMYMKGTQDQGIISTAKHFPGHGDTDTDSHLSLPLIRHSMQRLDSLELYPFKTLINNGETGIMIAHLFIPAVDSGINAASTLSTKIVTGLLKERLGFKGFVITDALDMQGVTKYYPSGTIEVMALQAGNDILLLPKDVPVAIKAIRQALDSNLITYSTLEEKCRHILELKYDAGLDHFSQVSTDHLYTDLNPHSSEVLDKELFQKSVTLISNHGNLIPLTLLDKRRIASVSIGDSARSRFQEVLEKYGPVSDFIVPMEMKKPALDSIMTLLKSFDIVIASLHHARLYPEKAYGIPQQITGFIDSLSQSDRVIFTLFGNPYILGLLKDPQKFEAILVTYQDKPFAEDVAAQVIYGGMPATGILPVSTAGFKAGTGIKTDRVRLAEVFPEEVGISAEKLAAIDSLASQGIRAGAYPGCQILFAMDGKIFYEKSFGHPSYTDTVTVTNDDLYDIASLTKVAATTLAMMKLRDDGKINLGHKLSEYLPALRNTNKENLTIRDVMTHQAGLQPWIPFYMETLKNGQPDPSLYSAAPSEQYPTRVAANLYLKAGYADTIMKEIFNSPVQKPGEYKYSDLGFYLLSRLVEHMTHVPFDEYVEDNFYKPMGLTAIGFNPWDRFPLSIIMPTEDDTVFRKQLLRGDVHDPGAAMLGGVSGHAGLFSNAADLAVIMQMLLNHGEYGGKQYILPSTVSEFTRVQFPATGNRRGLGFDKPPLTATPDGPVCIGASPESFGHSGFTGTYLWADPKNNLVYIFLSNRVNPSAENTRLSELNIRTNIHQAVYEIIGNENSK
jgi:beta-N-acetylhexosaminidase